VRQAVALVRDRLSHAHALEVEVDTLAQLDEALAAGVAGILLDNMDVATVREAVTRTGGRATLEVSGGVTLERARAYAETGVDVISVGALTTKAPWSDVSMVIERVARGGDEA
jgi:nicotinate-nucleotide pyrophosphorylase (carboxylating)